MEDTFFNQNVDITKTRSEEYPLYKVTYYYNQQSDFVGYIEEWAKGEQPKLVGGVRVLYKGDDVRGPILGYCIGN